MRVLILAAGVLLSGCAAYRTMRFESSVPASVEDSGGKVLCVATPCDWRVSRETCGFLDSSSGWLRVRGVAADGSHLDAPPLKTCAVREGTLIRFQFPGPQITRGNVEIK